MVGTKRILEDVYIEVEYNIWQVNLIMKCCNVI